MPTYRRSRIRNDKSAVQEIRIGEEIGVAVYDGGDRGCVDVVGSWGWDEGGCFW